MKKIKVNKKKGRSNARIVVIGGGTGMFTMLTGLRKYFENLSAILTMADDGGSAGLLREDFGILPPGDVRRALVALSHTDNKILSELFNYRFAEGAGLRGHSFGNLILTALERITGNFENAIKETGRILSVSGEVVPVTLERPRLVAKLENGTIIRGETNIDIPKHNARLAIKKVWLEPTVHINPRARKAIREADLIVIGPGDLYTSLIPNLLVDGVARSLKETKGKVAYVVNRMTKFGETNGFAASDFLSVIEQYLGKGVLDYVIVDNKIPRATRLLPYRKEHAEIVRFDKTRFGKRPKIIASDMTRRRGFLRYDPVKIAKVVAELV